MDFSITTPTLLFSAISLFILAFTNRFHSIAMLIRQFISAYQEKPDDYELRQINQFKYRLKLIKYTQALGIVSYLFCATSMVLIMFRHVAISEILFVVSLFVLIFSLLVALLEILTSVSALDIELEKISNPSSELRG